MSQLRAAIFASAFCLLVSCGGSVNPPSTPGSGGSSAGSAGTTGTAGRGGAAGTGTGGGGGGLADCPACVACVTTNCADQVTSCQANASCSAIYECGRTCTTPINDCVAMHIDAIQTWGSTVSACINANCVSQCATR